MFLVYTPTGGIGVGALATGGLGASTGASVFRRASARGMVVNREARTSAVLDISDILIEAEDRELEVPVEAPVTVVEIAVESEDRSAIVDLEVRERTVHEVSR